MKSMNLLAKILIVIVAIVLISLPIMTLCEKETSADSTKSTITAYDDYVFFVVEDSKTPLAVVPTKSSNGMLIFVVALTTIAIASCAYTLWYFNLKNTTTAIIWALPISTQNELVKKRSFFHPIRSQLACEEAAYTAAEKYFVK